MFLKVFSKCEYKNPGAAWLSTSGRFRHGVALGKPYFDTRLNVGTMRQPGFKQGQTRLPIQKSRLIVWRQMAGVLIWRAGNSNRFAKIVFP